VPDSIVYTDSYRSYNALALAGLTHHRINHTHEFAVGKNHINGIENFWNQAKRVLEVQWDIERKIPIIPKRM
jgi:transposase